MRTLFSVDSHQLGGATVLAVAGELDISAKRSIREALDQAFSGSERPVVLDLSEVTFMDSTGLALMIDARRRLTRARRGFAIACPSDGTVRRAFAVTGLDDSLCVRAGIDAALEDVQPAFSG